MRSTVRTRGSPPSRPRRARAQTRRDQDNASAGRPTAVQPASPAYRGDQLPSFQHSLLVPSVEGQQLLRIRLDPADATRILGVDRLLRNRFGAVRAVVMGPDGAVYVGVDSAIYRLIP